MVILNPPKRQSSILKYLHSHIHLIVKCCIYKISFNNKTCFRFGCKQSCKNINSVFIVLSQCNVRQSALQKFLKISIKNSKCATSNKHIQDGRPGRYANRRGSKIKAKPHQKDPPPPRNENVRDVITQKA